MGLSESSEGVSESSVSNEGPVKEVPLEKIKQVMKEEWGQKYRCDENREVRASRALSIFSHQKLNADSVRVDQ